MSEAGQLLTRPAYWEPLRREGCATPETGWEWQAQASEHTQAPVWAKAHSWGEFVFDQAWAQAYQRAGGAYYPKWICALPFTPVPGPRLGAQPAHAAQQLCELARRAKVSGVHILFASDADTTALTGESDWLHRQDIRYIWRHRGYRDFDDFLAELSSKKRKNLRRERRLARDTGLSIDWLPMAELPEHDWGRLYALYASTYQMRGQQPYLSPGCLRAWATQLQQHFWLCAARDDQGCLQAMAFFFADEHGLYGRHWGAAKDYDCLHFELCYYQGMEFCLQRGIPHFDAGVQGHHRLLRGFEPVLSHSLHHFAEPGFAAAVAAYLQRETAAVIAEWQEQCGMTAFKNSAT